MSKTPSINKKMMMGASHHFFLTFKKLHISLRNSSIVNPLSNKNKLKKRYLAVVCILET